MPKLVDDHEDADEQEEVKDRQNRPPTLYQKLLLSREVASKSAQSEPEKAEMIEELLDQCDTTLDRVKVLYEQFFLGIQKQPPTHIHTDVERKLRDLQQMQIRNTALRYRFATIQQKFGSYNNYWRRTLRQIEAGTYHRNLAKIGRQAAMTGEDIPDEILAAMPKRMREQVKRDRDAALAMKKRREQTVEGESDFLDELDTPPTARKTTDGAHVLDDDDDFDLDAYFRAVTNEESTSPDAPAYTPPPAPAPPARAASAPPARAPAPASPQRPAVARAPTFDAEMPTHDDFDPPTDRPAQIVSRPAPITSSPVPHANPAVRAAVGMRVATPPAGVPRVTQRPSQPIPYQPGQTGPKLETPKAPPPPAEYQPGETGPRLPAVKQPYQPGQTGPGFAKPAPAQVSRPLPGMPGAAAQRGSVPVESMNGPFPRQPAQPPQRPSQPVPVMPSIPMPTATGPGLLGDKKQPPPAPKPPTRATTQPGVTAPGRTGPPPGMTDADVNALYAKYVKAKEAVGEKAGPGAYGKLLQTINAQAPKIMEQYKAKGVEFQVVVKDNQVVIRAKPKP